MKKAAIYVRVSTAEASASARSFLETAISFWHTALRTAIRLSRKF